MRLFDKVVDRGFIKRVEAEKYIVLCTDVMYQHARSESDKKGGLMFSDYPFCKPPWSLSFVEFDTGNRPVAQYGSCCGVLDDPQWINSARKRASDIGLREHIDFVVGHDIYLFAYGRVIAFEECLAWACDAEGTVQFSFWCPVHDDVKGGRNRIPDEAWRTSIHWHNKVVAAAFTFANCSNVKLEDVTEDVQPDPKTLRRLKLPEVKRYTLNIAGHVAIPSREYNEGPQGVMPFHLCRGHFATYTADKPMFGNPKLVGRYWHPPHMKGKKENGEIIKDYQIVG